MVCGSKMCPTDGHKVIIVGCWCHHISGEKLKWVAGEISRLPANHWGLSPEVINYLLLHPISKLTFIFLTLLLNLPVTEWQALHWHLCIIASVFGLSEDSVALLPLASKARFLEFSHFARNHFSQNEELIFYPGRYGCRICTNCYLCSSHPPTQFSLFE